MGLLCSILGILIVRSMAGKNPAEALRFGTIGSAILYIAAAFGLAGMLGLSPAGMREQIRKVKALTDKPYGVDLLLPQVSPHSLN